MLLKLSLALCCSSLLQSTNESDPGPTPAKAVNIQLMGQNGQPPAPAPTFTARFTVEDLRPLLTEYSQLLPLPMRFEDVRQRSLDALERIDMSYLLEALQPELAARFPKQFDAQRDAIIAPVPQASQVTLETDAMASGQFVGPELQVIGFMLHDIDEAAYVSMAVRVMQTARKLLDSGDPAVDRTHPAYYDLAAARQLERMLEAQRAAESHEESRLQLRRKIGEALGIQDPSGAAGDSRPSWVKESRRFTYVIQDGQFIDKLKPLVDRINSEIEMAGFSSPSIVEQPGIRFDPDLGDVEILLPRYLLEQFLEEADQLERRMAEDSMITVEMVRLTDRDIVDGVVATRLNAQIQGVHDSNHPTRDRILRQAGINALTAVANRELQIVNANQIAAGRLPEGTLPLSVPPIELPPLAQERRATLIGTTFNIGADNAFFDGREQSYGFSYIGPDGIEHRLALDIADSLTQFWERIERNLIVHKIKKTPNRESFSVPVGPETKTFEGIAALISQQNQELVVATGTGALSELSATAGTWLVIKDFEITPIPGSSTALTENEAQEIIDLVTLTMILRDPTVELPIKRELVDTDNRGRLSNRLHQLADSWKSRPIRGGRDARMFGEVLESRLKETMEGASIEKKERNSTITLTFYSSQGIILPSLGITALGDANDLTSFTTQLTPNKVTPISSFFTKTASGTEDKSQITGLPRGQQEDNEKTMTHLVVRARFPTDDREKKDRDEGRYVGYFELPLGRDPLSKVNLPFLSSSEHPSDRLAQIQVGRMFDSLDPTQIREKFSVLNPQRKVGQVPLKVWESCTTRLLMTDKVVTDGGTGNQSMAAAFRRRFVVEVRSLLEYDEDFFDAPNVALRNMAQWNSPQRIVKALQNSTDRFPLERMIEMTDELGEILVPDSYIDERLAISHADFWGDLRIRPLVDTEIRDLRRDVALHFMRSEEMFGDAFLEAMALVLGLGAYASLDYDYIKSGPFNGYEDLVVFDRSPADHAQDSVIASAHEHFLFLRSGGYRGRLFEKSDEFLSHMPAAERDMVIRGTEILTHPQVKAARGNGQ